MRTWQTSADDKVCPVCAGLDGRPEGDGWVEVPRTYAEWDAVVKGLLIAGPPAHPNCRCSIADGDGA